MAAKKLIALSMLCSLLNGQRTFTMRDRTQAALGYDHPPEFPYEFETIAAVNALALAETPECVVSEVVRNKRKLFSVVFGQDEQVYPKLTTELIESMALKRYTYYVEQRVDDVREFLQAVYRLLFNGTPRKKIDGVHDYLINTVDFTLQWTLGEWAIETDLNHLVGATVEHVHYDYRSEDYLLVITECYGQFETVHYVDLLLHSTPLAELRRQTQDGVMHLSKRQLLANTTQLPITVKQKGIEKVLSITIR